MPFDVAVSLEGIIILIFKRRELRLREVSHLGQATQLTSDWWSWPWNARLSGFRSHALSVTLCPLPQRDGEAPVWAPSLRRVVVGQSVTLVPSILSVAPKAATAWSLTGWL